MKKVFIILFVLIFIIITGLLGFYTYALLKPIDLSETKESITIYDVHGEIIYESNYKKKMKWTESDNIPDKIKEAFILVEDKRFYKHYGIDPIRLTKAFYLNIKNNEIVEGGSTITQQYAKNLFLTNEQNIQRKIEELFYASRLEMQYSKEDILEGYLNTLYFGHGIYGIENASQYFYSKELKELTIAQIAMLTGIPNGPGIYSPFINIDKAKERQNLILHIFYINNFITKDEYDNALKEDLNLKRNDNKTSINEYYIDSVIAEVKNMSNVSMNKQLHIYTYYDEEVQSKLVNAIHSTIKNSDEIETAGVIMKPYSNHVIALSGGKDYTLSQFNRALYSKRQVASTIKPLLYYCALQQGFTPSTTFESRKTTFPLEDNKEYSPMNYNDLYPNMKISMINALGLSDNIYAVKTHLFLDPDTLSNALHDFNITSAKPDPSLALGTVNMSLLELMSIYNTFASTGLYSKPTFISVIQDENHKNIYMNNEKSVRILNKNHTLILNELLTSPFDIKNKTYSVPTLYGYEPKVKTAAKSGTSDFDSVIAGFNPQYTIGIWCGFDDNRFLNKQFYSASKQIWKDTFNALYENKESVWYKRTSDIEERKVNPITGEDDNDGSIYWYLKE